MSHVERPPSAAAGRRGTGRVVQRRGSTDHDYASPDDSTGKLPPSMKKMSSLSAAVEQNEANSFSRVVETSSGSTKKMASSRSFFARAKSRSERDEWERSTGDSTARTKRLSGNSGSFVRLSGGGSRAKLDKIESGGSSKLPRAPSRKKLERDQSRQSSENDAQFIEALPQGQGIAIGNSKSIAKLMPSSFTNSEGSSGPAAAPQGVAAEHSAEFMKIKSSKMESYSAPVAVMVQYPHPKHWSVDLFSWPHNAIRFEIIELYKILSSMDRMFLDIDMDDIDLLYEWLGVFFQFVNEFWVYEAQFILRKIESRRILRQEIVKERIARKSAVGKLMAILMTDRQNKYDYMPAGEALVDIRMKLNKICSQLFEYFRLEIRKYAKAIERNSVRTDWDGITQDMVDFFMNGQQPEMSSQILFRWCENSRLQSQLVKKHFKSVPKYNLYAAKFEREHSDHVVEMYRRSLEVVTENAKVAAERVPETYQLASRMRDELEDFSEGDDDYADEGGSGEKGDSGGDDPGEDEAIEVEAENAI